MKKTFLLLLLTAFTLAAFSQTADEVITKFIAVSGGKDKLNAINTLQYNQHLMVKSAMGDLDVPIQYYKEKNKFYRMQASMKFAGQTLNVFTIVNDSAGYIMMPAIPMLGSDGGIKKMNDNDRKMQAYQLDAAGYFANLVDYATKGSNAELLKDEKVNKEDCYQVKLTMSTGQSLVYFISKGTSLITRVDTKGDMAASMSGMGSMLSGMGGRVEKMEVSGIYSDYKDFNGIKFPTKIALRTQMGDSQSIISDVKINEVIDPKLYMPQ